MPKMKQEEYEERGPERRGAEVRCLNCLGRFAPSPAVTEAACPHCGALWRLTWYDEKSVKIRGPAKKP